MDSSLDSSNEEVELHHIDENKYYSAFEYQDPLLCTGIMKDVLLNDRDEVLRKISLGKSVRVIDNNGKSLLHLAVQAARDDMSMIDVLLQQEETDINSEDFERKTPLIDSILQKKKTVALYLIKAGANVKVPVHCTPLHVSVQNGLSDICEALIQAGADLNALDNDGNTSLHLAIHYDQFEIMCILLFYGAQMRSNEIGRPLTCSLYFKKLEFTDILLEYETEFESLSVEYAVLYNYPNLERLLSKIQEEDKDFCYIPEGCLSELLINVHVVEFIWKNFLIECDFNTFFRCLFDHTFEKNDFMIVLDFLKNSRQELMMKLVEYSVRSPVLSQLIVKLPENDPYLDGYDICAIFLSNGLQVWDIDLDVVYERFGYCELFRILLYMDIRISHFRKLNIIPYLYYSIDDTTRFRNLVAKILKLVFAYSCSLGYNYPSKDYELLSTLTILPPLHLFHTFVIKDLLFEIPKLTELARNELRFNLCVRYKIKNSCQFYSLLKILPFPKYIKNLISLKTSVYETSDSIVQFESILDERLKTFEDMLVNYNIGRDLLDVMS